MGREAPTEEALLVEGTLEGPADGGALEYTMLLTIRNERGEEIARELVGVGALRQGESRRFTLSVQAGGAGSPG